MNIVDVCILIVLLYNGIKGVYQGFIKILTDFFAMVAGIFLAYQLYLPLGTSVKSWMPIEVPYLYFVSFVMVWAAVFFGLTVVGFYLNKMIKFSIWGPFNLIGGCAFGLIKGMLIVLVVLVPLILLNNKSVAESALVHPYVPAILDWTHHELPKVLTEGVDYIDKE